MSMIELSQESDPNKSIPEPKDKQGVVIRVKDIVARAVVNGNSPDLVIQTVTKIEDGKVFLDNSPKPIIFTRRLVVIDCWT